MTNRDAFLKKLSTLSDKELAAVMCNGTDCDECPAATDTVFCRGIEVVEKWFHKEANGDDNS